MPPTSTRTISAASEPPLDARLELGKRQTRREALRICVVAAVAVALATVVVGLSFLVGTHMVAAWWLENHHGTVLWDIDTTNWRQGGVTSVSFTSNNSFSSLSDADLNHFRKLHRVVSLNLAENDRITNKGLIALRGLEFLRELDLTRLDRHLHPEFVRNSVLLTDACLVHLQALPRLESLVLSGNLITDQGLAQISKMASLKFVDLEATEVTDAGLVYLEEMKGLERVNLGATRVTKQALTRLQMARPDLSIELDSDPVVQQRVEQFRGAKP